MALVAFSFGGEPSPRWGGIEAFAGELITIGPGERVHAVTRGCAYWCAMQVPEPGLVHHGRVLTGSHFAVPPGIVRWQPATRPSRHLHRLCRTAIRTAAARAGALADLEAAHGLEQQLLHALITCLSRGPQFQETPTSRRHREILARLEDLLDAGSPPGMTEICAALGVSDRLLRSCCAAQLGMSPTSYRRRRRMQHVHRALRSGDRNSSSVAEIAAGFGFRDLGRFGGSYRAIYGELPSTTLRRSSQRLADIVLGRPRVKVS
jgi:AraC-like DNA-binding protein